MIGTTRKTTASRMILSASVRYSPTARRCKLVCSGINGVAPAVAKTRIIFDMREIRIGIAEFLADALDESAHIGAIADLAGAGGKTFAVNDVVQAAVRHVIAGVIHQQLNHLEFGHRQFDRPVLPEGAFGVAMQAQVSDLHDKTLWYCGGRNAVDLVAADDQFDTL